MKKRFAHIFWVVFITATVPVSAQVITTVGGNGIVGYSGDGALAINAALNNSISVAVDAAGNLFVADYSNHRIRKINTAGIISTIAGIGVPGFSGDGGLAINAEINNPGDICVDAAGNIYFDDNVNFRVRKIDAVTGIISTVAGNGMANYAGETVAAINAGIHYPNGITVHGNNLYISLFSKQRICKVDLLTGILSTIAGIGTIGYSGDGGAAVGATFAFPSGLSTSPGGELYIADYGNSCIRKINSFGIISTVAGNGTAAYLGDGGPATGACLNLPTGVFVDPSGNIYIADRNNYRIRMVDASSGNISTVAGSGSYGFGGDGNNATSPCVKLADPHKVRLDAAGNMYIADQSNNRIRKVDRTLGGPGAPGITISASAISICGGVPVTFNAAIVNGGSNPVYQWKKNGTPTGTNSPSYSSSTLGNGDLITCELTVTVSCGQFTFVSNPIVITVAASVAPSVTISSNTSSVCAGNTVAFSAIVVNGGPSPSYQWQVNGSNTGTNTNLYTSNTLPNGVVVTCVVTSSATCAVPATVNSNAITVTVNPFVTPAVSITATATAICAGNTVDFTAVTANSGTNPTYQWKINNINTGPNNRVFSTAALQDNDVVSCVVIADPAFTCVTTTNAVSNTIAISVSSTQSPSVAISASGNNICPHQPVTFTALTQNAGSSPVYTWQVNGTVTGTNSPVYTNNNLADADEVTCILTASNAFCPLIAAAGSNSIAMQVKPAPVVTLTVSNNAIVRGNTVQLSAVVNGTGNSFQWTPAGLLVNPAVLDPVTKPLDASTSFALSVTNTAGCTITEMIDIKVFNKLLMPAAFTPNNDGKNDIFRIPPGVLLTLDRFSVFDKWGNLVFSTRDINKGWDGSFSGSPYNSGTFVYIISGESEGKNVLFKGSFILIR